MRGRLVSKTWKYDPSAYAPRRYQRACGYEAFIPAPLPTEQETQEFNLQLDLALTISEAEQRVLELNRIADPALRSLSRLLLRTESIASSKVEGMHADARALAMAEARKQAGRSIGQQFGEIISNIDAMERAVERAASTDEFLVADLLDIHAVLMKRAPIGVWAGKLRAEQNWIGGNNHNPCGADYVPPPPEEVEELLQNLCEFCNLDTFPPLVQAAIAHAQFETIHPFVDGNGRTGRALIQMVLRRSQLAVHLVPPISVVFSQRREAYIDGLIGFRNGRINQWISDFAVATAQAVQLAFRYQEEIQDLQEFWRSRLRASENPRADSVTWEIIDALPALQGVSVPGLMDVTQKSQPAVNQGVASLERAGVLKRVGTSKRYRVWEPEGLLDLVVDLESGAI